MRATSDETPPPILYKYLDVASWLPLLVSGQSLKFTSRKDFNDPFDCRPAYTINKGPAGSAYLRNSFKRLSGVSPAQRLLAQQRARHQTKVPKIFSDPASDRLLDEVGVLCLSSDWNNMLLWSHYSSMHTGICVGFRSDMDVFRLAFPVRYSPTMPVIVRPDDDAETLFEKTFFTKAQCWEYEDEWRIIKPKMNKLENMNFRFRDNGQFPAENNGPGIYKFNALSIDSITMGMHISADDEAAVHRAIKAGARPIDLYKIDRPTNTYSLSRKPVRLTR